MPRTPPKTALAVCAETQRLADNKSGKGNWRRWGPYLSERQWGTVREDYSPGGNAWEYFPHDHARSRAYRLGDDGQRPALKSHPKLAGDPHFRDYVLFHEYFDGDNGRGLGASHQTGWTGLVAKLLMPRDPSVQ